MSKASKALVMNLLENYRKNIRTIAQLRYELQHPTLVSPTEMIDAMAYAKGSSEGNTSLGHVSNKTLYIALNYEEKAERINNKARDDILNKLIPLEQEVDRLEHYVALLDAQQAEVIRKHYFEGFTTSEISDILHATTRTIRRLKSLAIEALEEMYELM